MYEYEDRVAMATNKAKTSFRATTVAMTTIISSISTTIYLHIRDIVYTKGRKITPKSPNVTSPKKRDFFLLALCQHSIANTAILAKETTGLEPSRGDAPAVPPTRQKPESYL